MTTERPEPAAPAERPTPRVAWPLAFAVATALVALWTVQYYFAPPAPRRQLPFGDVAALQAVTWYAWLLLLPLVLRVARRVGRGEGLARLDAPVQLLAAVGFAVAHSELSAFCRWLLGVSATSDLLMTLTAGAAVTFASDLLRYGTIAAVYHAASYYAELRAREVSAARLAARLAEARLESLRARLEPHFLFNTLNSIAALVRDDPRAAEETLGTLSELLRASLAPADAHEVSLADELALVEKYTTIERVRFGDRLRVHVEVPAELLGARVPQLLLQPLVENAIRHGVAPREGPGTVWIGGAAAGGRLQLRVEDDGVGVTGSADGGEGGEGGEGIGLGATRERLRHLYGAGHRVDVGARVPNGTRVALELPLRWGGRA